MEFVAMHKKKNSCIQNNWSIKHTTLSRHEHVLFYKGIGQFLLQLDFTANDLSCYKPFRQTDRQADKQTDKQTCAGSISMSSLSVPDIITVKSRALLGLK